MKDFILDQLKKGLTKGFEEFSAKKFNETYQAGLGDINGPKPMKLKFYKERIEVSYLDFIKPKSFTINPEDIIELDMRVESINNTGKAITGALIGGVLAGGLGAIAMAGHASKQTKEDALHLVIKYKGENRQLVLQQSKNTHEIYRLLKEMR